MTALIYDSPIVDKLIYNDFFLVVDKTTILKKNRAFFCSLHKHTINIFSIIN
jgi:hypothetical protein